MRSCPERSAFSIWGRTVSSKPTMPGKMRSPRSSLRMRFWRISVLTERGAYPLCRSSPTVLGLVMPRLTMRRGPLPVNARFARGQEVAQQEDVQVHEEELVPGDGGLEGLARICRAWAGARERAGRLGKVHGAHHELRRDLASRPVLAVAVGQRDGEEVVDEAVGSSRLLTSRGATALGCACAARAAAGDPARRRHPRRTSRFQESSRKWS